MNPLALLNLVPSWVYAAMIACLVFLNVSGHFVQARLEVKVAKAEKALVVEQGKVAQLMTSIETANRKAADDANQLKLTAAQAALEGKKREEALRIAKSAADTELARLRDAAMLARSPFSLTRTPTAASSVIADTAIGLLETCASEYLDLGYKAEQHLSDLKMILAAWPTLPVPVTEPLQK